jgi:hypothetical protein
MMRQKRKRRLFSRLDLDTSVGVGVSTFCDDVGLVGRWFQSSCQPPSVYAVFQWSDNDGTKTTPLPWELPKGTGHSERPKTRAAGVCVAPGSSGRSQRNVNRLRAQEATAAPYRVEESLGRDFPGITGEDSSAHRSGPPPESRLEEERERISKSGRIVETFARGRADGKVLVGV